jgi:hypothetical protein
MTGLFQRLQFDESLLTTSIIYRKLNENIFLVKMYFFHHKTFSKQQFYLEKTLEVRMNNFIFLFFCRFKTMLLLFFQKFSVVVKGVEVILLVRAL